MKENLKAILPWASLILVVGGYIVRTELRMARMEDYEGMKTRQDLHWVMHMKQWEEMRAFHPGLPVWSDHIAECWLTVEKKRG